MNKLTESQIIERVAAYFKSSFRFLSQLYRIKREYPIKIGSNNCRADIVLYKGSNIFGKLEDDILVIVECKAEGRSKEEGIAQLKSYLCATDTPIGIFANKGSPYGWSYFKNLGRNTFEIIDRERFRKLVNEFVKGEKDIKTHVNEQVDKRIQLAVEANLRNSGNSINKRTQELVEQEAKKRMSEDSINQYAYNELQNTYNKLQTKYTHLESQLTLTKMNLESSRSGSFWGWTFFIIAVIIIIVIGSNVL